MLRISYGRGEKKGKLKVHELSKSLAELFEARLRTSASFCWTWKKPHSRARVTNQAPIVQKVDSAIHFTG